MMKKNILTAHALFKQFTLDTSVIRVLNNVSWEFNQGYSYAIMGKSGSGKSTLMHILAGLALPDQGNVLLNDANINRVSDAHRSKIMNSCLGVVFQTPHLLKELSVVENVMLKGLIAGDAYEASRQKAVELLTLIDLHGKADHSPASLSGGQQQRIAVLRALFNSPAFLLADEPTGNLDTATARSLIGFLLECHQQWKMGMIISTHDEYLASCLENQLCLVDGSLLSVQNNPIVLEQANRYHN